MRSGCSSANEPDMSSRKTPSMVRSGSGPLFV